MACGCWAARAIRAHLLALHLAQVLALLAWCSVEAGEAEQALRCLQALQQVADCGGAQALPLHVIGFRALLALGRSVGWGAGG